MRSKLERSLALTEVLVQESFLLNVHTCHKVVLRRVTLLIGFGLALVLRPQLVSHWEEPATVMASRLDGSVPGLSDEDHYAEETPRNEDEREQPELLKAPGRRGDEE